MRRATLELGVPVLLVAATALVAGAVSQAHRLEFENALVMIAIVVALYVFVGNSGVISFGHVSFVAVGAYLAGVLTVDPETKAFTMPGLFHVLGHSHIGTLPSLALAAAAGGIYALAVGLPLMRLSGLPAGIATFAVLGITYNVLYYWQKVGPTAQTLSDIPGTGRWTLAAGTAVALIVAYAYQRSRFGRMLRATREDPAAAGAAGISIYR
jgi:branched-chain amino acid transport system permease protein